MKSIPPYHKKKHEKMKQFQNCGEWRHDLAKQKFRCDFGLAEAMRSDIVESIFKFVGTLTDQTAQRESSAGPSVPSLVTAAKKVLPQVQKTVAEVIRVETDTEGKTKLSFTLPEKPVLDGLLQAAAQWLGSLGSGK